jgi:hypothetical protein
MFFHNTYECSCFFLSSLKCHYFSLGQIFETRFVDGSHYVFEMKAKMRLVGFTDVFRCGFEKLANDLHNFDNFKVIIEILLISVQAENQLFN